MGKISGSLQLTEDLERRFLLPKNTMLYNSRQLAQADTVIEEALDEIAEQDKKDAAKKKKKPAKKDPKKGEPEEEEAPKIEYEKPYFSQLRDLVRTERFETRMEHMSELTTIKQHLDSHNVSMPAQVLEKALYLPEDEQMNKEFRDKRYPDLKDQLPVNPFPAVKKGKKKKKKK